MARSTFGGTHQDLVLVKSGPFVKLADVTLTFWDAATGGTRYTDLLLDGNPVTAITSAGGQVPAFQGPDGVTSMWADDGDNQRHLMYDRAQGPQGPTGPGASNTEVAAYVTGAGPTKDALSATYGRTYRPEQYGAVGDGVADDLPAFQAIATAIAADVNTPAKIEITATHYLSDGVNFDGEDIECYLAAGCHVFTTAATSGGGTLGFIGHLGLGTAPTPRRGTVKVHGPGKVTGWLAGTNENAIGIVRYDRAVVDGPYVNAGHKGVTMQIGVPDARIRNITSDTVVTAVVTVEDQAGATYIDIDNIKFGTSANYAILASGTWARVRRVHGTEAHTAGGTSQGAVHVTSTGTLQYAEVDDVDIADVNAAKGVVVSGLAQDFYVDRIRIGAGSGNAVDLFNCAGGVVGKVTAPASPAGVALTGTTPAAKVRRLLAPNRQALASGESTLERTAITSTTISIPTGFMRLAFFEATKTETVTKVRVITGGSVPTGGTTTMMRVGVYEVASNGDLTLVASTPNDTTLLAAASTAYTKNLSASFVKRAGTRYAIGLVAVFSGGALQVPGSSIVGAIASEAGQAPKLAASVAATDLPATITDAGAGASAAMPYFVVAP